MQDSGLIRRTVADVSKLVPYTIIMVPPPPPPPAAAPNPTPQPYAPTLHPNHPTPQPYTPTLHSNPTPRFRPAPSHPLLPSPGDPHVSARPRLRLFCAQPRLPQRGALRFHRAAPGHQRHLHGAPPARAPPTRALLPSHQAGHACLRALRSDLPAPIQPPLSHTPHPLRRVCSALRPRPRASQGARHAACSCSPPPSRTRCSPSHASPHPRCASCGRPLPPRRETASGWPGQPGRSVCRPGGVHVAMYIYSNRGERVMTR